jgi:hypothetical protein
MGQYTFSFTVDEDQFKHLKHVVEANRGEALNNGDFAHALIDSGVQMEMLKYKTRQQVKKEEVHHDHGTS